MSLLEPDKDTVWVDDQVQATGVARTATALVGAAKAASTIPKLTVNGAHLSEEAGSQIESGSVTDASSVGQRDLVVYAVARKGSKVAAAGRAVLPEVAAGTTVPFQIYFVGDPKAAKIEVSAPPTTF